VKARQDLPVDAILSEWAETGPTLGKLIRTGTTTHPLVCHPYVDAGIHEADLRGAIGTGRPPREIWLAARPDRVLAVACRRAFLVGRRIPPPAAP
jgi:hypothetical protein